MTIANERDEVLLLKQMHTSVEQLLSTAGLPDGLSKQIFCDALSIGKSVGALCPSARELEVKLEIFGENSCKRWHQDNYMGRAIVSYTGRIGTEYTGDANVDFWELRNCGNNQCIIKDENNINAVCVGDILFIKGLKYPVGANGLVHKSPAATYHPDGRIVNRLCLKVDVS